MRKRREAVYLVRMPEGLARDVLAMVRAELRKDAVAPGRRGSAGPARDKALEKAILESSIETQRTGPAGAGGTEYLS